MRGDTGRVAELTTGEKYRRYVMTSFVSGIEPVEFERASGATVEAADGKRYLDLFSGISVVNAGHRHPVVAEAVKRQVDRYFHCASYIYYSRPVAGLAERLAQVAPGHLEKTFFCNSGAEAVEGAIRLAKAVSGKTELIALQMAFHGRTNATLSVTGNMARKSRGGPYLPGVAFAPAPYSYRCRFCAGACTLACADALEDTIRFQTSGDVAAFVAEPVLGEGGIVVPDRGYFRRVREILDRYGILFIDDEVQTGFGRTGTLFAVEQFGVEPDIMAMAKGIADGFPLGGFIAADGIADAFRPGEHLSTFGGNPVCCAAGLANLEVMQAEHLPERSAALGERALVRLRALTEESSLVGEVRGLGLMIGIELVLDRDSKEPAAAAAAEVRRHCREHGVLVGVGGQLGNVVRIQPPLVISEEELDEGLEVVARGLARAGESTT